MKLLGQMIHSIASVVYFQITFQQGCFCLPAHKWFTREPISPHPSHQMCGMFILLITANPIKENDYLMVASICISLITGEVGHVFQPHPILLQLSFGAHGRTWHVFQLHFILLDSTDHSFLLRSFGSWLYNSNMLAFSPVLCYLHSW